MDFELALVTSATNRVAEYMGILVVSRTFAMPPSPNVAGRPI